MIQSETNQTADSALREENERLRQRLQELLSRLKEPEEIVRAIRQGEVDAFVVTEPPGERIYTLRSADVLCRVMVEDMQEGAVALDRAGIILYCNWHFARLIKSQREAITGTSIFSYVPEECRTFFDALKHQSINGTSRDECFLRAADGTLVPVLLTMNPIPLEKHNVFCMIVTDLSEQKRQQELETAAHRKDLFLATLAHELRNPIAPIRNAAYVLRLNGVAEADVRWAVGVIERQVTQLSRLVDDLMDVSRITSGKIKLQLSNVDLRGVIGAAVEEVRPLIDLRRHELVTEIPPEPLRLNGDAARLTQVVANLLSNAAKFTPEQGRIWIGVERDQGEAVVRVRDTGVGIPADMLPKVFDLFTQVESAVDRSQEGLGIGLTLVKSLVEMHGGRVSASSQGSGMGAEFELRLPLLTAGQDRGAEGQSPSSVRPVLSPRRVLIVDDNRDSAESLAMLIRQSGHQTRVAFSGQAAFEAAREQRPQLVILDIGMPGINGYEVARRFRQLPELERAVLVALTGFGQDEDRQRSRQAGFDHHWVKPASLDAIDSLLESLTD